MRRTRTCMGITTAVYLSAQHSVIFSNTKVYNDFAPLFFFIFCVCFFLWRGLNLFCISISKHSRMHSESGELQLPLIGELTTELTSLKWSVKYLEERLDTVKRECAELEKLHFDVRTLKREMCANDSLALKSTTKPAWLLRKSWNRRWCMFMWQTSRKARRSKVSAEQYLHLNQPLPEVKSIFRMGKATNTKTNAPSRRIY